MVIYFQLTVGRHKDSDFVVNVVDAIVVIHDETELHPSLPLFRLGSTQELNVPCRGFHFETRESGHQQHGHHDPEHERVVIVVARVRYGPTVSDVRDDQDDQHLDLSLATFIGTLPVPTDL